MQVKYYVELAPKINGTNRSRRLTHSKGYSEDEPNRVVEASQHNLQKAIMLVGEVRFQLHLPIQNEPSACMIVRTRNRVVRTVVLETTSIDVFLKRVFPFIPTLSFLQRQVVTSETENALPTLAL